jgi:hypothetical protein
MSVELQRILAGKREVRRRLAALPFAEKLALLEKLRDRSLLIAASPLRRQRPQSHILTDPVKKKAEG